MKRFCLYFLLLSSVFFISSCANKNMSNFNNPTVSKSSRDSNDSTSLNSLINEELDRQYSSFSSLIKNNNSDAVGENLMQVTWDRPMLSLLDNVTAYNYGNGYLAAGFKNGDIRLWGNNNCPYLSLDDNSEVGNVWWDGSSQYIGVTKSNKTALYVYSLQMCGAVDKIDSEGPIDMAAVSPNGGQVSIIDEGRRIIIHNGDKKEQLSTLRYEPLAISYTPKGGMLMVLDKAGWIIFWSLPEYELVDKFKIPGGPFSSAQINGASVSLKPENSNNKFERVVWDLKNKKATTDKNMGLFYTKNNTLFYKHPDKKPNLKTFFKKPSFRVLVAKDDNLVMVTGLNDINTFYDLKSGKKLKNARKLLQGYHEWESVKVNKYGIFIYNGSQFKLSDIIYTKNNNSLMCRHVDGEGYYLWWIQSNNHKTKEFHNRLPIRKNIRKKQELIEWESF